MGASESFSPCRDGPTAHTELTCRGGGREVAQCEESSQMRAVTAHPTGEKSGLEHEGHHGVGVDFEALGESNCSLAVEIIGGDAWGRG